MPEMLLRNGHSFCCYGTFSDFWIEVDRFTGLKGQNIVEFHLSGFNSWAEGKETIEFSLNVFTEFAEFSDKNNIILKRLLGSNHYLLCERQGLYHCATETANREDSKIDPDSCLSDFWDSLNSLNSVKVLFHLGKTPISLWICVCCYHNIERCKLLGAILPQCVVSTGQNCHVFPASVINWIISTSQYKNKVFFMHL